MCAEYTITPQIRIPNALGSGVGEVWTGGGEYAVSWQPNNHLTVTDFPIYKLLEKSQIFLSKLNTFLDRDIFTENRNHN